MSASDALRLKPGVWAGGIGFVIAGASAIFAAQVAFGLTCTALGLAFFLWGTMVHGRHLWEPWWRGPIAPFVNAVLLDLPYEPGASVKGIKWDCDFSHVNVRIANRSNEMMCDLNLVIFLDRHIVQSRSRAPFAPCSIAPESSGLPQITLVGVDKDGKKIAIPTDRDHVIDIAPRHRLVCGKLPSGAEIEVDLATVVPLHPPNPKIWTKGNPSWIRLVGTYSVRGATQHVGWHQPLAPSRE